MRTCPKCKVVSPDSAMVCDCGYAFDPKAAPVAASGRGVPGPTTVAKFGACIGGFLVAAVIVIMIAQFINLNAEGSGPRVFDAMTALERPGLLFVGEVAGAGIIGATVALHLLKQAHRARRR